MHVNETVKVEIVKENKVEVKDKKVEVKDKKIEILKTNKSNEVDLELQKSMDSFQSA